MERNNGKKVSVKKTLGSIGTLIIFGLCVFVVIAETANIETVLYPLIIFVTALFGIKTAGGVAVQKNKSNNNINNNEE